MENSGTNFEVADCLFVLLELLQAISFISSLWFSMDGPLLTLSVLLTILSLLRQRLQDVVDPTTYKILAHFLIMAISGFPFFSAVVNNEDFVRTATAFSTTAVVIFAYKIFEIECLGCDVQPLSLIRIDDGHKTYKFPLSQDSKGVEIQETSATSFQCQTSAVSVVELKPQLSQ